jgi:hypothetical protein
VDRHLIAVEIRVERGADQGVDADGLPLDQRRLERLDAEPVERRGAVQQHCAAGSLREVPDPPLLLHHFAALMVVASLTCRELIDERLEEVCFSFGSRTGA